MRLTIQASARNKFNVHWDEQHPCNGSTFTSSGDGCRNQPESGAVYGPLGLGGLTSTSSPETSGYLYDHPRVRLITWSSPATNHMLFEAGFGAYQAPFGPYESPGNATRGLARVTEQCAAGCSLNGGIPNLTYRSANWGHSWDARYHLARLGLVCDRCPQPENWVRRRGPGLRPRKPHQRSEPCLYRQQRHADFAHAEPVALHHELWTRNAAFYVQDQWKLGRMTLQGALRFDRNWSLFPEQQIGPTNFLATPITFPQTPGVNA